MPMEMITELKRAGFYWREIDGVRALVCALLEQDGFTNGFSTRSGGVSPMPPNPGSALNLAGFNEDTAENIVENRRRFLKLFAGEWSLAGCWQVHGADIRVVASTPDAQPAPYSSSDDDRCDALVSNSRDVLACVKTADCVPILIGDPATGAFAAVHAGWRGTLASIVTHALKRLNQEFGARAQDVRVAIGPAAAACCYEVGSEVIHTAPLCTMCRTDLFFSYRREKSVHGKVGRLMAVIGGAKRKGQRAKGQNEKREEGK